MDDIDKSLETAAKHGCHPLRAVATYSDAYKLTHLRGPSGILVMLAEKLTKDRQSQRPHGGEPSAANTPAASTMTE